jgi:hypothetical protein
MGSLQAVWRDSKNTLQAISTLLVFDNVPVETRADYCRIDFTLSDTGPFTHTGGPTEFHIYDVAGSFITVNDTWHTHPVAAPNSRGLIRIEKGGPIAGELNEVPCGEKKVQLLLQPNHNVDEFEFTWFGELCL